MLNYVFLLLLLLSFFNIFIFLLTKSENKIGNCKKTAVFFTKLYLLYYHHVFNLR